MDFSTLQMDAVPDLTEDMRPDQNVVLHIDGDILCYEYGCIEDPVIARRRLCMSIKSRQDAARAGSIMLHLTADDSDKGLRSLIAVTQPYQGQRKKSGARKPVGLAALRDYLMAGFAGPVTVHRDREGDDGLGYASENSGHMTPIINSMDKDMQMLPGWHMTWAYPYSFVFVGPEDFRVEHEGKDYGHYFFWYQMLAGDSADHIPGLPRHPAHTRGVGPVAAHKLLAGVQNDEQAFQAVRAAYQAHYGEGWAAPFAEQASLLWIRRSAQAPINEWAAFLPLDDELAVACGNQFARVKELQEEAQRIMDAAANT